MFFIQSQATSGLYNLLAQADNLNHLFPCPNGKITHLGRSDGPSCLPCLLFFQFKTGLESVIRQCVYKAHE